MNKIILLNRKANTMYSPFDFYMCQFSKNKNTSKKQYKIKIPSLNEGIHKYSY